eukprot:XP_014066799.1 PREDICTED: transmembrane protein 62-like [Salmo salar]
MHTYSIQGRFYSMKTVLHHKTRQRCCDQHTVCCRQLSHIIMLSLVIPRKYSAIVGGPQDPSGNYSLICADVSITSGPKQPYNLFGILNQCLQDCRLGPVCPCTWSVKQTPFTTLMLFNLCTALGPWVIGELIDCHSGACFAFGVFIDRHFIEGSLTYVIGVVQVIFFNMPLTC